MDRPAKRNDEALGSPPEIDDAPPPSVLGDVEDAVAPMVEGELTPWMPPGQGAGEEEDVTGS